MRTRLWRRHSGRHERAAQLGYALGSNGEPIGTGPVDSTVDVEHASPVATRVVAQQQSHAGPAADAQRFAGAPERSEWSQRSQWSQWPERTERTKRTKRRSGWHRARCTHDPQLER